MSDLQQKIIAQATVAMQYLNEERSKSKNVNLAYFSIQGVLETLEKLVQAHEYNEDIYLSSERRLKNNLEKQVEVVQSLEKRLGLVNLELDQLRGKLLEGRLLEEEKLKLEMMNKNLRAEVIGLNKAHTEALSAARDAMNKRAKKVAEKHSNKLHKLISERDVLLGERNQLQKELSSLDEKLSPNGGLEATVDGISEGVKFFIHAYGVPLGLALRDSDSRLSTLRDLPWHYQIMRNNGTSVVVMVSEWLTPIFAESNDFNEEWDKKNTLVVHALFMERAKQTIPSVYEKVLKAKGLVLSKQKIFNEIELSALDASGFISVFDVVGLRYPAFLSRMLKGVDGLDSEVVSALHSKVKLLAEQMQ